MFWKGRTAIEGLSGSASCGEGFTGTAGSRWRRRLGLGGNADLQRINPDRIGDVLEAHRAAIVDGEVEPGLDLPVCLLGETDAAGLAYAFKARGDIDAVAHQVAVALLDDVAQMDADAELDAAFGRQAGIALDHAILHLDGAAHGVDHAAELDEAPVAGALDHATMMHGDRGIDQVAAQRPQPRQDAILVRAGEPAVADHIRDQDRCYFPGLAHAVLPLSSPAPQPDQRPHLSIEPLSPAKIAPSHRSDGAHGVRLSPFQAGSKRQVSYQWRARPVS